MSSIFKLEHLFNSGGLRVYHRIKCIMFKSKFGFSHLIPPWVRFLEFWSALEESILQTD